MIELTTLEAMGYVGTILTAGASAGFVVGYKMLGKNIVTSEETFCSIWSEHHSGNPKVILLNGKRTNTNCPEFKQSKRLCRLNNQKCKLID